MFKYWVCFNSNIFHNNFLFLKTEEPLCKSAGIKFCLSKNIPISSEFLKMVKSPLVDFAAKGKIFERIIALNIYKLSQVHVSNLFDDKLWKAKFEGLKFPEFKGILLDAPLSLIESPNYDWIVLPEEKAGPDIIALPLIISIKTTQDKHIDPAQCKEAIRTTDPYKFYFNKNGFEPGTHTKAVISNLKMLNMFEYPIGRIRIELPQPHPDFFQSNCVENYWKTPYFTKLMNDIFQNISYETIIELINGFYQDFSTTSFFKHLENIVYDEFFDVSTIQNGTFLKKLVSDPLNKNLFWKSFQEFSKSKKQIELTFTPLTKTTHSHTMEDFPQFFFIQTILIFVSNLLGYDKEALNKERIDKHGAWLRVVSPKLVPIQSLLICLAIDHNNINPILEHLYEVWK